MLKGNPKQKLLHELDHKSPEELLAYHVATLNDLREHIASKCELRDYISKAIHGLILDYTWLYSKRVLGLPYPDAYLTAEERVRYKHHLDRIDTLNYYLSEFTFLLDVTSDLWEEEERKSREYAMEESMSKDVNYDHKQIQESLQKGKSYQLPNKQNKFNHKSNHLRVVGE